MGMAISVPASAASAGRLNSRRTISTPITSSPWMPAVTKTPGPGRRPWITWADMVTGV